MAKVAEFMMLRIVILIMEKMMLVCRNDRHNVINMGILIKIIRQVYM